MSISGGNTTEVTISGLTPSTTYFIEVVAVNSAGIGAYSSLISSFISGNDQYGDCFIVFPIVNCYFRSIFIGHHIAHCHHSQ